MTKNKLMASVSGVFTGIAGSLALERILTFVDMKNIEIQTKLAEKLIENQDLYNRIYSVEADAFRDNFPTLLVGMSCAGAATYLAVTAIYCAIKAAKE